MAIDSASKRASVTSVVTRNVFIIPDGTIDQGDRQTASRFYSGILAAAPAPSVFITSIVMSLASRSATFSALKRYMTFT